MREFIVWDVSDRSGRRLIVAESLEHGGYTLEELLAEPDGRQCSKRGELVMIPGTPRSSWYAVPTLPNSMPTFGGSASLLDPTCGW
jgi:hypothetical protein